MDSNNSTQRNISGATGTDRITSNFRIDPSMKERFVRKCDQLRLSQSAVIEACVEAFLGDGIIIAHGKAICNTKVT